MPDQPATVMPKAGIQTVLLVALLLDSGFRRNDESKAAAELVGKAGCAGDGARDTLMALTGGG